ncbi:hypothetical protein JB92DRAFT_2834631 [Gautieria morchelliformis]|nr:hypothetical protein JB92DRAFT_2834631 [Gautieria morchelliformis]
MCNATAYRACVVPILLRDDYLRFCDKPAVPVALQKTGEQTNIQEAKQLVHRNGTNRISALSGTGRGWTFLALSIMESRSMTLGKPYQDTTNKSITLYGTLPG